MIEIAKCAGIPFTPDPNIMREDEVAAAEQMLIDFRNQGGVGFSYIFNKLCWLWQASLFSQNHFQQGYGWMYPDGNGPDNKKPPPPPSNDGSGFQMLFYYYQYCIIYWK